MCVLILSAFTNLKVLLRNVKNYQRSIWTPKGSTGRKMPYIIVIVIEEDDQGALDKEDVPVTVGISSSLFVKKMTTAASATGLDLKKTTLNTPKKTTKMKKMQGRPGEGSPLTRKMVEHLDLKQASNVKQKTARFETRQQFHLTPARVCGQQAK